MRVSSAICCLADEQNVNLVARTSTRSTSSKTASSTSGTHSSTTGHSSATTTGTGTHSSATSSSSGTGTSTSSSATASSTKGATCSRKTTRSLFSRATRQCGDKVTLKKKEYTLGESLGQGAAGEVFDVVEKVESHEAVCKVYNNAAEGLEECKRAKKAEQGIDEEKQADGTLVGFQIKIPGDKLNEWETWKAYFKDKKVSSTTQKQCRDLMQAVREGIADDVVEQSEKPGVDYYHSDYANVGNVHIKGTSPDSLVVKIFDWSHVTPKGSKTKQQIRDEVMNRLKNDKNPLNVFKKTTSRESSTHNAFSDASCNPDLFGPNPWADRRSVKFSNSA
ncbi:hypothetical protein VKT23_015710 [Stygiomarasmius scandens]|uniref:Uncharacterized protein n=1 Tax=Marasmiellus scandens TaxID=2682957 RepID=A0ABR1J1K1_9AGAR